jgi:hypothetical protein
LRKTDSAPAPASRPSIEGRARISFLALQCPTFYTSRAIDFPDGESGDPSNANAGYQRPATDARGRQADGHALPALGR